MIKFKDVAKKYNNKNVISKFNLEISKGEIVVLIGESGSGKTTLLKMINRLIPLSSGDITVNNESIKSWNPVNLRRKIGYVIQQHGLFPHMTIKENIQIIPKLLKTYGADLDERTEELLKVVGLDSKEFLDRYPSELSGGQQQRVGVARALITDPEIILMDEPFSALDPITRGDLQEELINIQTQFKKTIVFVTHDMDEALKLADRICILKDGNILQYDTPENILRNPNGEYVENFIGKGKIWSNPSMIKAMDAAIENPVTIGKNRTIIQAMEIIREKKIDGLLVTDKEKNLLGYVELKGLRKINKGNLTVGEVMNVEVPQVDVESDIVEIISKFDSNVLGYLAVTDSNNKLKGLITKSSLLSLLGSQFTEMEVN